MTHRIIERATDLVATAGVVSPIWVPMLGEISHLAGLLMPILGCVWLGVQIWKKSTERGDRL